MCEPYEIDGYDDYADDGAPKRRRSWLPALIGGVVVAITVALIGWAITTSVKSADASGRARDSFVAVRLAQVSSSAAGRAVKVESTPSWNNGYNRMEVTLTVGSCSDIDGFMRTPGHPKSLSEVSGLYIIVPGIAPSVNQLPEYAYVSVTDPDWLGKIRRSALAHCV